MKKKHALTVFVSPGSVVASERSGQQSQEQLLIFLGQEIDSDLHRSFCLENSNGKCCSACVCVCVFGSLTEFLANSDEYVYKLADNLLDAITNGEHSKTLKQNEPVSIDCHVLTDLCYC